MHPNACGFPWPDIRIANVEPELNRPRTTIHHAVLWQIITSNTGVALALALHLKRLYLTSEPLAKVSAGFAPERSAIGLIKLINIMK